MYLLTSTKGSFSAKELQIQLGHHNYNPIWGMLHKLCYAMGDRKGNSQLSCIIELDEGFFSTETSADQKVEPLKRGRDGQKKSKVLVMAESTPVKNPLF